MNMNVVAAVAGGLVIGTAAVVPMTLEEHPQTAPAQVLKTEQPTLEPQVYDQQEGGYVQTESLVDPQPVEPSPKATPNSTFTNTTTASSTSNSNSNSNSNVVVPVTPVTPREPTNVSSPTPVYAGGNDDGDHEEHEEHEEHEDGDDD